MVMVVDWALSKFSVDLGIDLGTANTLVFAKGQGVIIREASVVAVERKTGEVCIHAIRGGAIFGEHDIRLIGDDEEITLRHRALSRRLFAKHRRSRRE